VLPDDSAQQGIANQFADFVHQWRAGFGSKAIVPFLVCRVERIRRPLGQKQSGLGKLDSRRRSEGTIP
jgi:hypothetical protein